MPLVVKSRGIRVPQPRKSNSNTIPPPVGGLNTLSPIQNMDEQDCVQLYNMIPYQYGLRVRSGYREWATNVGPAGSDNFNGMYDDSSPFSFHLSSFLGGDDIGQWISHNPVGVRTLMAFNGSHANGSQDRLFAATDEGIWDVTSPTTAPVNMHPYSYMGLPDGPAEAGRGVGAAFVNSSGYHYYAYCDGAHGYTLYSEESGGWTDIVGVTYANRVDNGSTIYAASQVLEDIYGVPDPANFRFVVQWKNRLWFCVEGSPIAWYLEIGAFAGAAYPMPFAPRFPHGGELVGLWSWMPSGGATIDDFLVGISRGGDVVIYQGTDPALPGAFLLKGVYWVGQPPPGRRIASQFGGDLFVVSVRGCISLSRLIQGGVLADPNVMASAKIMNLFNRLMVQRGNTRGWSIGIHPTDNIMIITVPAIPGENKQQLVMSLAGYAWSQHVGLPMECIETWRNKLYFGTNDGKVCVNDVYVDGLSYDQLSLRPILWGLQTSFQKHGSNNKKRINILRTRFITDGTPPAVRTEARFDFDVASLDLVPTAPTATPTAWDVAVWDVGQWGGGSGIFEHNMGATGLGTYISVAMRGTSVTNTTLVGFELVGEEAGII